MLRYGVMEGVYLLKNHNWRELYHAIFIGNIPVFTSFSPLPWACTAAGSAVSLPTLTENGDPGM